MAKGRLQLRLTPEALAELERRAGGKDKRQAFIESWLMASRARAEADAGSRKPASADDAVSSFNNPVREKRTQARKERKAALADEIKAALPANPDVLNAAGAVVQEARHHRGGTKGGALPSTVQKKIDTLEQVTTVGRTYCPRHTPKSCEPDCKYRVRA